MMPIHRQLTGRVTYRGFRRGTYKWRVQGLNTLEPNEEVESSIFEFGGFKWKLGLFRGFRNPRSPEMIRIFVFSCNDVKVKADVAFAVNGMSAIRYRTERRSRSAYPFRDIDRHSIPADRLTDSTGQLCNELTVIIDLKNVSSAADEERGSGNDVRTIDLEIISHESIQKRLNGKAAFGLLSSHQEPSHQVCNLSLVHLWAGQCSGYRYWLCKQSLDGRLTVERCLNEAGLLECFEDLHDENGDDSGVILLKEETRRPFPTIKDDTMIVFCKIYEPESYKDLTYFGHMYVKRTTTCSALLEAITDAMDPFACETYDLYLETGHLCIKDITFEQRSLEECGLHSGSCVIVRKRDRDQAVSLESVQRALRQLHGEKAPFKANGDSDASGSHSNRGRPRGGIELPLAIRCNEDLPLDVKTTSGDDAPSVVEVQGSSEKQFDVRSPLAIIFGFVGLGSAAFAGYRLKHHDREHVERRHPPQWLTRSCWLIRRIPWRRLDKFLATRPCERYRPSHRPLLWE